jgi:hypothetical protein
MTATALITPAELATELGTDARTTRKFLRSITPRDEQPGKGSRWGIKGTKSNLATLRKQYAKFEEAQQAARAARAEKAAPAPVEAEAEIDDTFDSLEGPTDDELADDSDN